MFCSNHPNAKAIASCRSCEIDLCGMCSSFVDDFVLCEKCHASHEAEKFVSAQTEKNERPEPLLVDTDTSTAESAKSETKNKFSKVIQSTLILIGIGIIAFQLLMYANPPQVQQDSGDLARQVQLTSLVECMLIFREIGITLQDGRMPANALRCADSAADNTVSNVDGIVYIAHPNPQHYGYSEISVSSANPDPNLVRIAP